MTPEPDEPLRPAWPPAPRRGSFASELKAGALLLVAWFAAAAGTSYVLGYLVATIQSLAGTPVPEAIDHPKATWASAPILLAAGALAGGLAGLWYALRWWRRIDEAARQAHLEGWYWGASFAFLPLSLVAIAALALPGPRTNWLGPLFENQTAAFGAGIVATTAILFIGYLVSWIWWWRERR